MNLNLFHNIILQNKLAILLLEQNYDVPTL